MPWSEELQGIQVVVLARRRRGADKMGDIKRKGRSTLHCSLSVGRRRHPPFAHSAMCCTICTLHHVHHLHHLHTVQYSLLSLTPHCIAWCNILLVLYQTWKRTRREGSGKSKFCPIFCSICKTLWHIIWVRIKTLAHKRSYFVFSFILCKTCRPE